MKKIFVLILFLLFTSQAFAFTWGENNDTEEVRALTDCTKYRAPVNISQCRQAKALEDIAIALQKIADK